MCTIYLNVFSVSGFFIFSTFMRVRRSASGTSLDGSDTRLLIEEKLPHLTNPRFRRKHRSKRAHVCLKFVLQSLYCKIKSRFQLVIIVLLLLTGGSFWILVSNLGELRKFGDTSYNASPLSEPQVIILYIVVSM